MQRRFITALRLFLLLAMLAGMFYQARQANALSGVTITLLTPWATWDSNNSCGAGPRSMYVQAVVTNISGGTLGNLKAKINFPTTNPGVDYTGAWSLDDGESDTRYIGTLANGASVNLYYFINYPCWSGKGPAVAVIKTFSITLSDGTVPDVTQNLSITTRTELSSNAGGQLYSFDIAPGTVLGQVIKMTTIYDFGNVGSGNDLGIQPAGNTSFNSGCYQLIANDITNVTGITGLTAADDNVLYKTGVSSGGGTNRVTVDYYFKVVCVSTTATTLSPWADMVSGTQQKYTGNYTTPPTCVTTPCDQSAPGPANPFQITKSVTPTHLPTGGTATYTVSVNNISQYDVAIDKILDVLPGGVTYGELVNGVACPGTNEVTFSNSSSLPVAGATGSIEFVGNILSTMTFPPSGGYTIPAGGSISVCYSVTVTNIAGPYTNSAKAQSGNVSTGPATSTVTVGTPSFTITKSGTLDMAVVAPSGRADAGDVINYSVVIANTGDLPLTGVTVSDFLISNLDCDGTAGVPYITSGIDIPVGENRTCIGSYPLTQTDLDTNGGGDGDIDNTATADTNETEPQSSSQAVPITQVPGLNVTKDSVTTSIVSAGQTVPYAFTLTNTGNVTLTGVSMTDPMCSAAPVRQSGDTNNDNQLQTTETWIYTCNHTVIQAEVDMGGNLRNTVTADSTQTAPDTDTLDIPVTRSPGLNVAKSSGTTSITAAGQVAAYNFAVTNTGNVTLSGVTVTDPMCNAAPLRQSGDTNDDNQLQTTETWLYTCSHTVTQMEVDAGGNLSNTVTADSAESVPDTDTLNIPVTQMPGINLAKTPATQSVAAGGTATFTLTVTNTGNVTLTGVTVTDALCTTGPTLAGGDTNNDNQLQTTEIWAYACSVANVAAGFTNAAGVTTSQGVTASDTATVTLISTASINVIKSSTTTSITTAGQVVPYTFTVTNTGNATLTGVTVTDPMCSATPVRQSGDTNNDNQLQTIETWIYTCSYNVTQTEVDAGGNLSNSVTVDSIKSGPDTDTLHIPITQTFGINVVKSSTTASITTAGQVVPYTFTVTNTGNVSLTGVTVTDPMCSPAPAQQSGDTNNDNRLQPIETWVYTCNHTVTQVEVDAGSNLSNTVTVDSTQTVPDTDTFNIPVAQNPALRVVKNSTTTSITINGQVVPYTFTVTNTGNMTLTGVTVIDPMCAAAPVRQSGDANNDNQLQATETWLYACSHTVTQAEIDAGANLSNTVTADSTESAPDTDTLNLPVGQTPGINIAKTPAAQTVISGGTATFTLTLTNTGNVTLTGVTVTDAQCTTGPTLTGGDTNNDSLMQVTETWTFACSVANVTAGFTNTASVTTGQDVSDSDTATVAITVAPAMNVVKEVASSSNGPWNNTSVTVTAGDTVYYRVRVANTGNATLTGLSVEDGMPGCTLVRGPDMTGNKNNIFEAGEEWTYTCSITAILGTNNNTATADSNETSPASDTASYTGAAALVADPAISKRGDPTRASVGESITFTLTVTNHGNAPAASVVVTDALPAMFDVTAVSVTGAPLGTLVNVTPAIGVGPAPYTVTVTLGGDLGVTDVVTITIGTTVNSLGNPPIHNTAALTTLSPSDLITNNSASVAITIRESTSEKRTVLPATGFARDVLTTLPDQPSALRYASTDLVVEIPVLGLKIPIVGVPKKSGTWNVSWLGNQAGWLQGTAFPTWNGNSVLTGHVYLASGLPGPFIELHKLKYGDKIIVHAYGQQYTFAVQTQAVFEPNDSSVMKHEEKPWLTLMTCKDYDEKTGTYKKRLVVRAALVSVEWE